MTRRFFAHVGLAAVSGALALTGCSTTLVSGLAAAEPTTGASPTAGRVAPRRPDSHRPWGGTGARGGPASTPSRCRWAQAPRLLERLPADGAPSARSTRRVRLLQLDPLLLNAIRDAARSAQAQGIDITITSGWRSKGFQQRLFDDAVRRYGSVEIAQQFVASPEASRHVVGEAVDIAGNGASDWLIRNGAQFGLCQIYANENWHFELATDGNGRCPPLRPNAAG